MASKQQQQPIQQWPKSSSAPQKPPAQSLIFVNVALNGRLLQDLKRNNYGIQNIAELYLQNNNEEPIKFIRIDIKTDDFAKKFLDQSTIGMNDKGYSIQTSKRSSIISKVAPNEKISQILQDLSHNYLGIEKISRFYNSDNTPDDFIQIDFKSEASVTKILKDNYIFIGGKRHSIQPCRSLIINSIPNETNHSSEKPKQTVVKSRRTGLNEQHVKQLFAEHQLQLETMIRDFENKWDAKLSSLANSSANNNNDKLLPIIKDLSIVCQQFSQQNIQIQKQLNTVYHRVQDLQMTQNNGQYQQGYPSLSIQNGH